MEIVTWNDFGESHYIGPVRADSAQPNSQAWVNGFDHTGKSTLLINIDSIDLVVRVAWLDMTGYFAQAFKSGTSPILTKDTLYLWARTHPKEATASNDPVGKPTNFELVSYPHMLIDLVSHVTTHC